MDHPIARSSRLGTLEFLIVGENMKMDGMKGYIQTTIIAMVLVVLSTINVKAQNRYDVGVNSKLRIEFVPNIHCGFSNFSADDASPKGRLSCGVDFAFQFIAKEKIKFIPENYFSEASLGYSLKGSAVFPLHYLNIKLLPFGYRYHLPKFTIFGKLGVYTGYTFSSIETNYNSFKSNIDVGLAVSVGVEYWGIGAGMSYERGFTNVCNSNLSLKNSCVFINLSYRLVSFKKNR